MATRSRTATDYKLPDRMTKWSDGVKANLEAATGKTLAEWIKIARVCPHQPVNDRLKWFKQKHGLSMARAGTVLEAAFGQSLVGARKTLLRWWTISSAGALAPSARFTIRLRGSPSRSVTSRSVRARTTSASSERRCSRP